MGRFLYRAQDKDNKLVSGTLEAADKNSALQTLSEMYPLVTSLELVRSKKSLLAYFRAGIPSEAILATFQQLSVATSAGVPIKGCLDTMAADSSNPRLQQVLLAVSKGLSEGLSFSDALSPFPEAFDAYQVKLVKAGEVSGKLPETLRRLAEDMESREILTNQVRSAIAYPTFVLGVALILSGALLAFGVPQVQEVYASMGSTLPLPTQILVYLGSSLSQMFWAWILLFLGLGYVLTTAMRSETIRPLIEDLIFRVYPFGPVYRLYHVANFSRTLGLLYRSGVPLTHALEILQETVTSLRIKQVVSHLQARVINGIPLSTAMRGTAYFPSMAVEMVATGENSGSLDRMLEELDRFYSRRCELAVRTLTSLIEPVMTVAVGILLGGIILGLGLPFLNMPSLMM